MNKKIALRSLLLLGVNLLFCMQVSAYITKEEWEEAKATGQLPDEQRKKLDAFFAAHQNLLELFTAEKQATPIHGSGPELTEGQIAQGYRIYEDDPRYAYYVTTPNRNFPGTFDPKKHLWVERPKTLSLNVHSPEGKAIYGHESSRRHYVRALEYREQRLAILAALGFSNHSPSSNIVIPIKLDDGTEWHLKGTHYGWSTYAQVASGYFNAVNLARYLRTHGYNYIRAPKTALYHFPGQQEMLDDRNWGIVSETVKDHLSPEKVIQLIQQEPPAPCIIELNRLFSQPETPFWDDTVSYRVAEKEGKRVIEILRPMNLLFTYNDENELVVTFVDLENPSIAGPYHDEKRSMEYSTQKLPLYKASYTNWVQFVKDVRGEER